MRKEFYQMCEGSTYAAPQYGKEIRVKVGEDLDQQGAISISREGMEELGIGQGDLVEIYGAWVQEAKAILSNEQDITVIRMDKAIRKALPCRIGQYVGVRGKYR